MLLEYFTRERYPAILPTQSKCLTNAGTNRQWEIEIENEETSTITSQEEVEPALC